MRLCTSRVGGIVWDSGCDLLPTKTSRMLVLLFGRYPSLDGTCSQVFTMRLVNPFRCFILEAIILLFASLILLRRALWHVFSCWALFPPGPLSHSAGPISGRPTWRGGGGGGRKPHIHGEVVGFGLSRW